MKHPPQRMGILEKLHMMDEIEARNKARVAAFIKSNSDKGGNHYEEWTLSA